MRSVKRVPYYYFYYDDDDHHDGFHIFWEAVAGIRKDGGIMGGRFFFGIASGCGV